jgi:colanic acid/amylovoran biosynthesis glycosyltransferase
VEKKGFTYLLEAVALLGREAPIDELVLVGEGPLLSELRERARALGIDARVRFAGAQPPERVRELLEEADLLAMPCVVAADGNRDSMPVVVKEALAMELPVVCSDEVGLPELVRPEFGRLVPPGEAAPLAAAIRELLELGPEERAAMGRAGRAFVTEHANVHRETARLAELIAGAAGRGR